MAQEESLRWMVADHFFQDIGAARLIVRRLQFQRRLPAVSILFNDLGEMEKAADFTFKRNSVLVLREGAIHLRTQAFQQKRQIGIRPVLLDERLEVALGGNAGEYTSWEILEQPLQALFFLFTSCVVIGKRPGGQPVRGILPAGFLGQLDRHRILIDLGIRQQ